MSTLTAQITPTATRKPIPRRGPSRDRRQAVLIQRVLTDTILNPETPEASRASCAVAWTRVQEAKRIIDGKPLPGALRPELAALRASRRELNRKAWQSIAPEDMPAAKTA
jgi:hypothetical protein